ncbi:MAG: hypothetical protein ACYDGM_09965 [Vulcanimicrobiaceae bacterium]
MRIIRGLFEEYHTRASRSFDFDRSDITTIARRLRLSVPKNLGDNIYAIRHGREELPDDIKALAPKNKSWLLLPNGRGKYRFHAAARTFLPPDDSLEPTLIPDATPQILNRYDPGDEQAVLARILYSRLIDIFLGVAAYRMQSHLRTTIKHFKDSQIEIDEVYVGTEQSGAHFLIPVQAKGYAAKERISCVQLICDSYWCAEAFPNAVARVLAAKIIRKETVGRTKDIMTIALIEAKIDHKYNVTKSRERHFKLVPSSLLSDAQVKRYRRDFLLSS